MVMPHQDNKCRKEHYQDYSLVIAHGAQHKIDHVEVERADPSGDVHLAMLLGDMPQVPTRYAVTPMGSAASSDALPEVPAMRLQNLRCGLVRGK